jgi:hypothetical protein
MPGEKQPMNPHSTVCVCKHNGKEVGRIAATAPNAAAYIDELARAHGGLQVEYVEDSTYAMVSRLVNTPRR